MKKRQDKRDELLKVIDMKDNINIDHKLKVEIIKAGADANLLVKMSTGIYRVLGNNQGLL